jgi:hypothetical protein
VVREFQVLPQMKDTLRLLFYLWHQHCWFGQRAIGTKRSTSKAYAAMEAVAKEAEPPHMEGGVWVWLPDRGVCVSPYYAAKYREKNPLPESLQPPCDSPPCAPDIFERSERLRERGDLKRSLSQGEIQERMSSCSQEMFSPSTKVATPETPSAAAMKRKRKRSDDGRQWGIRSDVSSAAYKAKELTARDGSEMCECGVSLDDCKCE